MTTAFVALGGNMGDPAATIRLALQDLDRLPRTRLQASSFLYRTPPLGPAGQPDYINAAARLETGLAAITLLRHMQEIEYRHGRRREREERWGPRSLDLDLLLFGGHCIDQEQLQVPHPGMCQRAFVLRPLLDVAPADTAIPGRGRIGTLLQALDSSGIERLAGQ